ncbi:MAG: RrF2 family transcriptional regulator [Candidatus Brocadiia bacterium]
MSKLLRISEAASLGLHAAVRLAEHPRRPVSARDLARRLDASEAHLAKVLQRLVRAGLVSSTRGPRGGFALARAPGEVSLLDVYEAVEGPVEPTACPFGRPVCRRGECIFGEFLSEFDARFRDYLATTTLDALACPEDATEEASHVRS